MADGRSKHGGSREAFWRGHIERQPRSGATVRGYCRGHGLKESAFYWWRREVARRDAARPKPAAFVPVTVVTDGPKPAPVSSPAGAAVDETRGERAPRGRLEILLTPGGRVRVTGRVERAALVEALAAVLAVTAEGRRC